MKTLLESIIGKRGSYNTNIKLLLRPGQIVRYRDGNLAMYIDAETAYNSSKLNVWGIWGNEGCFVYRYASNSTNFSWQKLEDYSDSLRSVGKYNNADWDIVEIYPGTFTPQISDQKKLNSLIKSFKNNQPITINRI